MQLQLPDMPVASEVQLIEAFVLAILSIEIIIVFIAHKRKNPESSAVWIRVFIISSGEFITIHVIAFIMLLLFGDITIDQEILYRINLCMVDVECILLFRTLHYFSKKNVERVNRASMVLIWLYAAFLAIHITEFISGGQITILPDIARPISMITAAIIPIGVAVILSKRSEPSIKRYYRVVIIALLVMSVGVTLHLRPIQMYVSSIGISLDLLAIVSMILSISGTAMLLISFYFVPYLEDLFWKQELVSIYVLDTKSNVIIYKELFSENIGGSSDAVFAATAAQDNVLFGGLSSLDDFMSEMIKIPSGNLEMIDKGGLKLLFTRHKHLLFIAASKKNLPVIKVKLADFGDWFFIHFGELVKNNVKDPTQYAKAHEVVSQVFRGE
jgi:hypothetical protein